MAKKVTVTSSQIKKILTKNGNLFHLKVAELIESLGWEVEVSPYYTDFVTGASREIDIIALKSCTVGSPLTIYNFDIVVRLFIECKYIDDDIVIALHRPTNIEKVEDCIFEKNMTFKTLPGALLREARDAITSTHHWLKHDSVAKLFSNANGDDPMFKGISQVLHSSIYASNRTPIGLQSTPILFDYPTVIVNSFSRFYKVGNFHSPAPLKVDAPFIFETNYAYTQSGHFKNEYFLVDILDYNNLESHLINISNELEIYKKTWDIYYSSLDT